MSKWECCAEQWGTSLSRVRKCEKLSSSVENAKVKKDWKVLLSFLQESSSWLSKSLFKSRSSSAEEIAEKWKSVLELTTWESL